MVRDAPESTMHWGSLCAGRPWDTFRGEQYHQSWTRDLRRQQFGRFVRGLWLGGKITLCLYVHLLLLFELSAFARVMAANFAVNAFLFLLHIRLVAFLSLFPFSAFETYMVAPPPVIENNLGLDVLSFEVRRLGGG
ncbi:hypothetical protein EDB84DRAFT_1476515 [Lactarius hengduanensis]|nr:hypothetical protein EDB84DRAFT_1476515 [Lactarius hengduanensis]